MPACFWLIPRGRAQPVEGGYRIKGTWSFGSGIHHAEWVLASAAVPEEPLPAAGRIVVLPRNQVTIYDNIVLKSPRTWRSGEFGCPSHDNRNRLLDRESRAARVGITVLFNYAAAAEKGGGHDEATQGQCIDGGAGRGPAVGLRSRQHS